MTDKIRRAPGQADSAAGFFAFQHHEMQLLLEYVRVTWRARAEVGSDAGRLHRRYCGSRRGHQDQRRLTLDRFREETPW